MSRTIATLVGVGLTAASAVSADPPDRSASGVFIAHHPAGLEYSVGTDWCQRYRDEFAIKDCSEQNPRIDVDHEGQSAVWFVLAAFTDSIAWAGAEFGLGSYNRDSFFIVDHGPCGPAGVSVLQLPTEGWPGPDQGIALTSTRRTEWQGTIQPVYYFAGYAYAQDLIPLGVNPATGSGGTVVWHDADWETLHRYRLEHPAEAFGAMGLLRDGVAVFPKVPPMGRVRSPWIQVHVPDPEELKAEWQTRPPVCPEIWKHSTAAVALGLRDSSETASPLLASGTLQVSGEPDANPIISFTLLADAKVTVRVFDMDGRLVRTPLDAHLSRGEHAVRIELPLEGELPGEPRCGEGIYSIHLEIDGVMSGDRVVDLRRLRPRRRE